MSRKQSENVSKGKERESGNALRRYRMGLSAVSFALLLAGSGFVSCAANYGEAIGGWLLSQLFWVALVIFAIAIIGCLVKRAWVAAGITAVCGAVILALVRNPAVLEAVGSNIVNAVLGSG